MQKALPFSQDQIKTLIAHYPTPFHLYDEKWIRENYRAMKMAFSWNAGYRNFYAVKACPNPSLIKILTEEWSGADCSSLGELILSERIGLTGKDIMFTSNETPLKDYEKAYEMGANINLDDITHIDYLLEKFGHLPSLGSFRYNPGSVKAGNVIIGKPEEAKFGVTHAQALEWYKRLQSLGVTRFGLHTMVASNELNTDELCHGVSLLFDLAVELYKTLWITFEYINIGGGFGIPYKPGQSPLNIQEVGERIKKLYEEKLLASGHPETAIVTESGRYITGPFWYLVTTVLHEKHTYKDYIWVDACMANLMRPGMYGSYHHITVLWKEIAPADRTYDIVGWLCENNDKFALDRTLPEITPGDILVIHDTGAHGHAMGFNYNAKLRSAEILMQSDGIPKLIRRAETLDDYFATVIF